MVAVQHSASAEAVQVVAPLGVPGWAEGNCTGCAGCHGIVMLLMSLDVGAKFEASVFIEVNVRSVDD